MSKRSTKTSNTALRYEHSQARNALKIAKEKIDSLRRELEADKLTIHQMTIELNAVKTDLKINSIVLADQGELLTLKATALEKVNYELRSCRDRLLTLQSDYDYLQRERKKLSDQLLKVKETSSSMI